MAQILRLSVFGTMPTGEEWSVNPCWEINGSGGAPVSTAQAATIATACAAVAVPTGILQLFPSTTAVVGVRVEARSLTGVLESQAEATKAAPALGSSAFTHPYQTAVVVSLRTPGVGPSSRGRLYFPATGVPLQSTNYRMSTSVRDSTLTGAKTYLLGLEAAIVATLPNANLTVWSRKTANFHDVNQLQVGDVVDTQRRRRDTLVESYGSVAYP